ncbi:hypothetical protein U9K47_27190 [Bacillus toyonensis]|uniref:hypothetical protein n=1 Tax=Bacillus TaxID=1386 RepID=UPI0018797F98|nr:MULTISPECIES: hypothetical protein [Bacillus]MBE7106910.1 hypothetical protein [Bacillus cereus]MCS3600715.1 hypothetical protein [Bacillus sp. JUb91]HDR7851105.1 hypothetical protein [Bacillus toyonensis]
MAGYIYGGYNGYTSEVSGFTDANYYGSGATTVDFTQINLHSGGTWNYTIELQRRVDGTFKTTDTLSGSFSRQVTRSFNITDNLPGEYRIKGKLTMGSTSTNYTDGFMIYR